MRESKRGRERDQEWRDLLSGSPVIRPIELWIRLGHDPSTFTGVNRAVVEQGMIFMGYTKQPVHPLQICTDRFVWVREPWPSDALWPDLSDDPILLAVMERYVESVVARLVHWHGQSGRIRQADDPHFGAGGKRSRTGGARLRGCRGAQRNRRNARRHRTGAVQLDGADGRGVQGSVPGPRARFSRFSRQTSPCAQ